MPQATRIIVPVCRVNFTGVFRLGLVNIYADSTHSITNIDLPVAAFSNGVVEIPEPFSTMTRVDNQASGLWYTHWINSNGVHTISAGPAWLAGYPAVFRDGRVQLKQNLIFLLRTASPTTSFWFHDLYEDAGTYYIDYIETPTSYAYSGIYSVHENSGQLYTSLDHLLPFKENYLYRNFAYNPTNVDSSGWLNTGVLWDYEPGGGYGLDLTHPAKYEFIEPTNQNSIQPLLSSAESQWTCWMDFIPRNHNII